MDLVYNPKTKTWGPGYKVEIFFDSEEQRDKFEKALRDGGLEPARPHGRWEPEIGDIHSSGRFYVCSCCGRSVFVPNRRILAVTEYHHFELPGFCPNPNCGAKMDLEGSV